MYIIIYHTYIGVLVSSFHFVIGVHYMSRGAGYSSTAVVVPLCAQHFHYGLQPGRMFVSKEHRFFF